MTVHVWVILLLSCCVFASFSMDVALYSWYSLSSELKVKIIACCDTGNRKSFLRVNRELSQIGLHHLVRHSPVYLTRREHIKCLIQSAQDGQEEVLKNVIAQAPWCDHADVLNWLPIFGKLSEKSSECFSHHKLIAAFFRGDQDVMNEYVCKVGHLGSAAEITTRKLNPLLAAILTNDSAMAELAIIRNPELINRVDSNGCTPLYLTEDVGIARLLLSCRDIEVNKGEETGGTTPLEKVTYSGNTALVSLLLKHPNCRIDKEKDTPLHIAASQGYNDIITILLEHDETLLDVQDEHGYTAVMYAVENERANTVSLLLGYEPDYMMKNKAKKTARDLVPNEHIKRMLFMHEMNNWPIW